VKSKKTTTALKAKVARLNEQIIDVIRAAEALEKELLAAPHGSALVAAYIPLGATEQVVASGDARKMGEYVRLRKLLRQYDYEKSEIESWLSPPKGRSKGRRNDTPKPIDPTIAAAMEALKGADGRKLTALQLAHKYSGLGTHSEKRKWVQRFRKANQKAHRPKPR